MCTSTRYVKQCLLIILLSRFICNSDAGINTQVLSNGTSNISSSSVQTEGWVSSPDKRGTADILRSCISTIFLCTWTALHLNLPASYESKWAVAVRKARWMVQAILGPEFVLYFAVGQRYEAKMSVLAFGDLNYPQWTLRHGFYANMGGIVLQPRDGTPFPISARQLHHLVQERHLPFPNLDVKDFWDKSKADGFAKVLTCLQICWLALEVFGRIAQNLSITTLELTTMSYILCALATYVQWAHKPLDIATPTVLKCDKSMSEILLHARERAAKPYRQTPLDFIDNQAPSWSLNIQPYLGFRVDPRERPLKRITNDRFPMIGLGIQAVYYAVISFAFAAIHFVGWNFSFPSYIEMLLWRIASLIILGTTFVIWLVEGIQDGKRYGRWKRWWEILMGHTQRSEPIQREVAMMDPSFVPLWEFVLMVPVALVYASARGYILLEIFLSLRSLPADAFSTVIWSNFIPHL